MRSDEELLREWRSISGITDFSAEEKKRLQFLLEMGAGL